ncbi:hypothetical protein [Gimesia panareensis]|uniref:hypothetical protein n=1 Tax=Gimesia panareensis TaxID=2527978 RepID=UPI0011AB03D5|nr:hypothetical protein [Gimesia panareensis]
MSETTGNCQGTLAIEKAVADLFSFPQQSGTLDLYVLTVSFLLSRGRPQSPPVSTRSILVQPEFLKLRRNLRG